MISDPDPPAATRSAFLRLLAGGLAAACIPGVRAETFLTPKEALQLAFPGADSVHRKTVPLPAALRTRISETAGQPVQQSSFSYFIGHKGGAFQGYAVLADVMGKHQPISYLMAFTPAKAIRLVEILAYREAYGGEIRRDRFRRQFYGHEPGTPLRLNADIRNIAGATISCRSLLQAANLNLACLSLLASPGTTAVETSPSAEDNPATASLHRRTRLLMGTLLEVTIAGQPPGRARAAAEAVFAEISRLESLWSPYQSTSSISRLNRGAARRPVAVDPETAALLERSLAFHHASGGRFSLSPATPGPGFAIDATRRVRFLSPAVQLHPGGIAKGTALAHAARLLHSMDCPSALLNFGGQVLALDPPPGAPGWPVHLRDPRPEHPHRPLTPLSNTGLSVSSTDQRGHHLLDPQTSRPAQHWLATAVLDPDPERADAWSTALFATPAGAWEKIVHLNQLNAAALAPQGDWPNNGFC